MVLAWAFWMYFPLWDQLRTDLTVCLPANHISTVPVEGIRFPYLQVCPLWDLCFIFTYALAVWVFDPLGGHSPPQIKNHNSKDTHDSVRTHMTHAHLRCLRALLETSINIFCHIPVCSSELCLISWMFPSYWPCWIPIPLLKVSFSIW